MLLDFLYPAGLFLLTLSGMPSAAAAAKPKNAILLSDVQSLTLYADRQTTHRRVPASPQLKCASQRAVCAIHKVDVMRCTNQGSSYGDEDVQWSCTASLPPELKLGSTDVVCEGYSGPQDPYVLKGSCGVEYRLVLTAEGERRYPDIARGGGGQAGSLPAWIFWIVFVAIVVFIVYSAFFPGRDGYDPRGPRRANNYWGGGGGGGGGGPGFGGGGGGWNDPPPPYPGTKPAGSGQGWRPGFWSGLAGGTAAGYYAGNRAARNNNNNNSFFNGGYGSFGDRGSTWGGSSDAGPSRSGSGSSSSSSGARYESTGFGSTSRR